MRSARLTVFLIAAGVFAAHAQELEPRAYSNTPTGLTFAIGSYTYAKGSVHTDPSLPIDSPSRSRRERMSGRAGVVSVLSSRGFHQRVVGQAKSDLL